MSLLYNSNKQYILASQYDTISPPARGIRYNLAEGVTAIGNTLVYLSKMNKAVKNI